MQTGPQIDFLSDFLLATALTGRHDILSRIDRAPPVVLRFSEWDASIDLLRRAQEIPDSAFEPLRKLTRSIAENMVGRAKKSVITELAGLTSLAIEDGVSASEFIDRINHYAINSGFAQAKPYLVENLYRTGSGIGYGAGELAAYFDPDLADEIWGFRYIATDDDRVRPTHWALNGTELPKDDPFWLTHWPGAWTWNCRCTHEIILNGERHSERTPEKVEPGFDASLTGLVKKVMDLEI